MSWYTPLNVLTEPQCERGLSYLFKDGLCAHAMTLLVTGAFLPGIALAMGANNFVIGLLASLGPVSQMLQIPAILLVQKVALRKLLTVGFAIFSRCMLLGVALLAIMPLEMEKTPIFLVLMLLHFGAGSVAGCAWNSWIKDVIPEATMGSYLARRMSAATALGAALTVAAGFGVDFLTTSLGSEASAYGVIFAFAGVIGLIGAVLLGRVPEPRMEPVNMEGGILGMLFEPLKDFNFRRLLLFTATWNFTIILAGAFFTVYMLTRIGLSMGTVILLAVFSQVTNIYFLRLWGAIADRFSNKSVLRVTAPLFILCIILYPFTTMPDRYSLTIPILILIHFLGGVSTAGFTLCAGNIALRLAPRGKATAYLGANAFCGGIAATVAPLLGGLIGTIFATRELSLRFFYRPDTALDEVVTVPALVFQGLDFVFFSAAVFGLYSLHRLSMVEEAGTVTESEVRNEVISSVRQTFATASNIAGVRRMTFFPYELLIAGSRHTTSIARKAATTIRDKL